VSAPVDVLAVLDSCARNCAPCYGTGFVDAWTLDGEYNPAQCHDCEDIRIGRAAVAELIAADREYDDAHRPTVPGERRDFLKCAEQIRLASIRRAAALARLGGAA
jgi:hypothetical protein